MKWIIGNCVMQRLDGPVLRIIGISPNLRIWCEWTDEEGNLHEESYDPDTLGIPNNPAYGGWSEKPKKRGTLDDEYETYLNHKSELLANENEGKWVLIHKDTIDVKADFKEALSLGYDKYYPKPFMVHQINKKEPVYQI